MDQLGAVRQARRAGRARFEPVSDLFSEVRPLDTITAVMKTIDTRVDELGALRS